MARNSWIALRSYESGARSLVPKQTTQKAGSSLQFCVLEFPRAGRSSSFAAAAHLKQAGFDKSGKLVFVIGEHGIMGELALVLRPP